MMDILLLVSWNRKLLAVYSLANDPKHPPDLRRPYLVQLVFSFFRV